MRKSRVKYGAKKLEFGQSGRRMPSTPRVLSLGIALLFSTVPMPLFAEAGPGENISIALSNSIVASPMGTGPMGTDDAARAVPGALVDYFVAVTGPIESGSPATSFAITDMIPAQLSLFVGDLAQAGTGPAAFTDNDSGLEFSFDGLASSTDSIEFSSNDGQTFDYVPVADTDGFDQNVTDIKLRPRGALLPTSTKYERFSIRYRMKVK